MKEIWNWRNLSDGVKTAKSHIGKTVRVHGGGMFVDGVLIDVTAKREAMISTAKRGVQGISPLERIEVE